MRTTTRVLLVLLIICLAAFGVYQFTQTQESRRAFDALQEYNSELHTYLAAQQEELAERENLIWAQQGALDEQAEQFMVMQLLFEDQREALDEQTLALIAAQALFQTWQDDLDAMMTDLYAAQTELEMQTVLLAALQVTLNEKQLDLERMDLELLAQRQRIEAVVGVRSRIIVDLSEELRKAGLNVAVDAQTGAITMEGAVLFDVGRSTLKPEGRELLERLIPVYVRTLMQPEYRDYVAEFIIEGHTESSGNFLLNLRLSQERALAVAEYCLADGFGGLSVQEQDMLRRIMTANGRSSSTPILGPDGQEDMVASRRVEIKFRLTEAEMIDEMRTIMEARPTPDN